MSRERGDFFSVLRKQGCLCGADRQIGSRCHWTMAEVDEGRDAPIAKTLPRAGCLIYKPSWKWLISSWMCLNSKLHGRQTLGG